jgi:hypothetical protein
MVPEVRMRRPIRYQPKPVNRFKNPVRNVTRNVKLGKAVVPLKPKTRKSIRSLKRPSPVLSNTSISSANRLYDPKDPSPRINTSKLDRKMKELLDMLEKLKQSRRPIHTSMNQSAKAYLNAASYDDPLLDGSQNSQIKLKGIKGSSLS